MRRCGAPLLAAILLGCASTAHSEAAVSLRTAGGGFTDAAPVSPLGGNTGTTLGEQRRIAVQYALELWGKHLDSPVSIELRVLFSYFGCGDDAAIIATASATEHLALRDDSRILYPSALADRLAGHDLSPGRPDIDMRINADLDGACSERLGGFYYGLDGEVPRGQIDLVSVTLHELAHGLGFSSLIDPSSGYSLFQQAVSPFDLNLFDRSLQKAWSEMSPSERKLSAVKPGQLVWSGATVSALAPSYLEPRIDGGFWGTDSDGGVLLYTPTLLSSGSSVSHFDSSARPDLLMEPFASLDRDHALDLTVAALRDLGWLRACGDAVVDDGEQCDDGPANRDDGFASCQTDCRSFMHIIEEPAAFPARRDAGGRAPRDTPLDAGADAIRADAGAAVLAEGGDGCSLGGSRRLDDWLVLLALGWHLAARIRERRGPG